MSQARAVSQVIPMPWHSFGGSAGAFMLHPGSSDVLDPFIGIDAFTMPHSVFAPHPHAGMSAVTWMWPESPGGTRNRDTLGDNSLITPGELHWLQGGSGMIHEETPEVEGLASEGLQIFVNLNRAAKHAPPAVFKALAGDVPVHRFEGGSARIAAGQWSSGALNGDTAQSPINAEKRWATRVNLFDLSLDAAARVDVPIPSGHRVFIVVRSGALALGAGRADTAQGPCAVVFEDVGTHLALSAAATGPLRAMVCSGAPIREPIVQRGPFVGNTLQDIVGYHGAYQRGEMGVLAPR